MRILATIALVACNTTVTTHTQRVATLGYSGAPSIVIVTRGHAESAAAWAASLRASSSATIVAEVNVAATSRGVSRAAANDICRAVREATPDRAIDEIIVVDAVEQSDAIEQCISNVCDPSVLFPKNDDPPECRCIRYKYEKAKTILATQVFAIRASSCRVVAQRDLPDASAESEPHAPIEFGARTDDIVAAQSHDKAVSRGGALSALARVVPTHRWQELFPRSQPTVRTVKPRTFEVLDPRTQLERDRTYWVLPPNGALRPSARVTKVEATTATLETTGTTTIEPRDELHITTDVQRFMVYGALAGGTVSAQSESHGTATGVLAGRISFKVIPVMAELRLDGDLVPGLDAARWTTGGAAGFRHQLGPFAPVAFGELGIGRAHQGSRGARAFGGYAGVGAGVELAIGRWSILADVRRRWFHMGDWERKDGTPIEVTFPDRTWISTTLQLGVGNRF